jgi:hypothetical protein
MFRSFPVFFTRFEPQRGHFIYGRFHHPTPQPHSDLSHEVKKSEENPGSSVRQKSKL